MPMPVTIETTDIAGILIIKTGVIRDDRGYFSEAYSKKVWAEHGFHEDFVQDNLSLSAAGTLRGLHYQIEPEGMGKLVRCVSGSIFDVAVDLRRGSETFGQWMGEELSAENGLSLWIPSGFAHGFLALEDNSLVHYKCTAHHAPDFERSLHYACPTVNVAWPMAPLILSPKDAQAPCLEEADYNFE